MRVTEDNADWICNDLSPAKPSWYGVTDAQAGRAMWLALASRPDAEAHWDEMLPADREGYIEKARRFTAALSPVKTDLFELQSSAVFSPCLTWRYRLDREVQADGLVYLYSGINGSTAGAKNEDQTSLKWRGFTLRNAGRKYIAINPFAKTATNVKELAQASDPIGPENDRHIAEALAEADIIVPCWGNRSKVPERLRWRFDWLLGLMLATGKPMKAFGFTQSGDPKHPLMLGYDTPLVDWPRP